MTKKTIDLRIARAILRWGMVAFSIAAPAAGQENYTLTTYYPSPSGVYKRMLTTADTILARDGGKVGIGLGKAIAPQQVLSVGGSVNIDQASGNKGAVNPGLTFGSGSGEGIASKRDLGGNQFGLDFYSQSLPRMSITNGGNVGIGTTRPAATLDVEGSLYVNSQAGSIKMVNGQNEWDILTPKNGQDLQLTPGHGMNGIYINGNGYISVGGADPGDGSNSPSYPIEIRTGGQQGSNWGPANYNWLSTNGHVVGNCSGTRDCKGFVDIWSANRIVAAEFDAYSDSRIKTIVGSRNPASDLDLLGKLRFVDYRYRDQASKGSGVKAGLIAQEVEKVYPQAVHNEKDFIPNFFQISTMTIYDAASKTLEIRMDKPHGLHVGDRARIIGGNGSLDRRVAGVLSETGFSVEDWPLDDKSVFVYGKQVDDYRVLDYDQVFTVGLSAVQGLSAKVAGLSAENQSLKLRLERLEKRLGLSDANAKGAR